MTDVPQPPFGAPPPGYGPPPQGYGGPPAQGYGGPPPAYDAKAMWAEAKADKARAKAMRPWYRKKRWWAAGIVVLLIAGAALGGGGSDDTSGDAAERSRSAAPAGGDPAPAAEGGEASGGGGQEVYAIGQTAHTGDFDVVVHAVEDPFTPANQFEPTAQAGHRFVAVEAQLTNTGDDAQTYSTLAGAEVTDHLDRAWTVALAGLDRPQLGGDVQPGDSRRGWMVFEVAEDATDLEVRIKGNLTATGSLFALS